MRSTGPTLTKEEPAGSARTIPWAIPLSPGTITNCIYKDILQWLVLNPVECVATIGLAADKISPSGSVTRVVEYARWPVFYATGSRDLILPPVADFTVDKKIRNCPICR